MKLFWIFSVVIIPVLLSCNGNEAHYDASGVFEAEEIIVSSEVAGRIIEMNAEEGDTLSAGRIAAVIDSKGIVLQKEQVEASISALQQKTSDVQPQVAMLEQQVLVQQSQLSTLEKEKTRFEKLVQADAATPKQLDDIVAQIDVMKKQIAVTRKQIDMQRSLTGTQNRSILSEKTPLEKRVAILDDQLQRTMVQNPLSGTILTKYAYEGEFTAPGKALYKIADLSEIILRAYISGSQLSQVKLNQPVKVLVDEGSRKYKTYDGHITWISNKAEFTPKTIQTKEERANLVYAIKIKVKNDGYLKIGMYGEVELNSSTDKK